MDPPIVHMYRGEEKQVGVTPRKLESNWVHRSEFAGMSTLQVEHGKSRVSIRGHDVPHRGRDAKALVEAREVADMGNERRFEAADVVNLKDRNINGEGCGAPRQHQWRLGKAAPHVREKIWVCGEGVKTNRFPSRGWR